MGISTVSFCLTLIPLVSLKFSLICQYFNLLSSPLVWLPWWLKESAYNAGDQGSIPGQEDLLEEGMSTHSSILA